jgi:arginine:ornithine antiporter/lysine permease
MLNLTSSMSLIPYLFVAGYGLMIARRGETYDVDPQDRSRDLVLAGIATVYTIFMLLAGGSRYLLLSSVLYAPGTALYIWSRREQGRQAFTPIELGIFAILAFGCVAGIYALATGQLAL